MPIATPARRIALVLGAAAALAVGGAAVAATGGSAGSISAPAVAGSAAQRVPTTLPALVIASSLPTRGGSLLFPMHPLPTCVVLHNFGAARSGGRTHEATDIIGTLGQFVYAVKDGVLVDQVIDGEANSSLSGNSWELRASDGDEYDYMHLSGFAPGLQVGSSVVRGQLIGFVGSTGNPGANNYHLHFEVHPGGGAAVDPVPLLAIPLTCTG